MSALRTLLASLWATLWLSWRVLGVRLRRAVGSRRLAPAGVGGGPTGAGARAGASGAAYLPPAAIPVEGVDYDPAELPADLAIRLDDIRGDLLDHARATTARRVRRRKRRRRRTASLAMAALVTLAVLGAAATALMTGSTGIPAVDRLLGIYEEELSDISGGGDIKPDPRGAKTSVQAGIGQDGRRVVGAAYVGKSRNVCLALAITEARSRVPIGSARCVDPAWLESRFTQNGGQWSVAAGQDAILFGIMRGDVESLVGYGPNGRLDVELGKVWVPQLAGFGSARLFIALERDALDSRARPEDFDALLDPDRYKLIGRTWDGQPITITRD